MVDGLSERERDCVRLTMDGLTNDQIARRLCIGEGTVKTHLSRAYEKLGLAHHTGARTKAAVMLWCADHQTHAGRLLRMDE